MNKPTDNFLKPKPVSETAPYKSILLKTFRVGTNNVPTLRLRAPLIVRERGPGMLVKFDSLIFQKFALEFFIIRIGALADFTFGVDDPMPGNVSAVR